MRHSWWLFVVNATAGFSFGIGHAIRPVYFSSTCIIVCISKYSRAFTQGVRLMMFQGRLLAAKVRSLQLFHSVRRSRWGTIFRRWPYKICAFSIIQSLIYSVSGLSNSHSTLLVMHFYDQQEAVFSSQLRESSQSFNKMEQREIMQLRLKFACLEETLAHNALTSSS